MSTQVERTLDVSARAPACARELVRSLTLEQNVRQNVELIVTELVTNSVVHSEATDADRVSLRLRCSKSGVSGEVCDTGDGFEWENATPDLSEPGGLGLMLVDQLAAKWGVRRNGETCVWFECVDDEI